VRVTIDIDEDGFVTEAHPEDKAVELPEMIRGAQCFECGRWFRKLVVVNYAGRPTEERRCICDECRDEESRACRKSGADFRIVGIRALD
jgi:hypothetical protein